MDLAHPIRVYHTIRDRITALEANIDEQTLVDTLEGLTDLHEMVAAIVRSALFDEALVEGLKAYITTLQERADGSANGPPSAAESPATP